MTYSETTAKLAQYRERIAALREEMRGLQETIEPEAVKDYRFATAAGEVSLSQLFGEQRDLFVIHNMGASCPYCTLWADGFNGVTQHLANRAAFVVSSPDVPAKQAEFAASRGWRFPMVSHQGSSFARDMGYGGDEGWMPGVSVFRKAGSQILRVADTGFCPGDEFCAVWHFFDLIPEGAGDWEPRYKYAQD
jgi:predicted dithiol-disulfide oxidoreductase (DUF899 family)